LRVFDSEVTQCLRLFLIGILSTHPILSDKKH